MDERVGETAASCGVGAAGAGMVGVGPVGEGDAGMEGTSATTGPPRVDWLGSAEAPGGGGSGAEATGSEGTAMPGSGSIGPGPL